MAHAASRVQVIAPRHSHHTSLIGLVGATRNIRTDILVDDSLRADVFQISDRSVKISGFWPSVEYLLDKFPEPELLLGDVTSRCVTRSLTNDLLAMGVVDGIFVEPLSPSNWVEAFPIGGTRPSLLDLTYLAVLPNGVWAQARLGNAFDAYLTRLNAEAA